MNARLPSLEEFLSQKGLDRKMCVLHTRPRCEKKLAAQCAQFDVPVYYPAEIRRHVYGGRVRESLVPLFSGYVFSFLPASREAWARQNQYVANVLKVAQEEELIHELLQVDKALASGAQVEVFTYLVEGRLVRVRSGPMKGLEGIVQSVDRNLLGPVT